MVDPKHANDDTDEVTAGVNVYFYKHALKWQNNFGIQVLPRATSTTTQSLFERQLQFMF
ncbi:MAG TPA: hypothetical protein VGC79_18525 [Polyangiaceae bacterium]